MTLNINLPSSWTDLDQNQLRFAFGLIASGRSSAEVRTHCMLKWGGIRIIASDTDGMVLFSHNGRTFTAAKENFAYSIDMLRFIDEVPEYPVHLEEIGGIRAVGVDFQGVELSTFLMCDNLYQGYLHTRDEGLLQQMATLLYPTDKAAFPILDNDERISVFYWFAALKVMLSQRFDRFFQPSNGDEYGDIGRHLQEIMDAEIRALTKGDITKENEILAMDTWRALTELNAQAREYEDMKKSTQ